MRASTEDARHTRHQELLICGWIPGTGRRADTIGSLVLGGYDGARLRYAGTVGTGFTHAMLADLMRLLAPLERDTSPFSTPVPSRCTSGSLGVDAKTVRRYVAPAEAAGMAPGGPPVSEEQWRALAPGLVPAAGRDRDPAGVLAGDRGSS